MRNLCALSLVSLCLFPRSVDAQACGGKERWPVKVGADPDRNLVDLNPMATLLHPLAALTNPPLPPHDDETTRLVVERNVRVVNGRLVRFKRETEPIQDEAH